MIILGIILLIAGFLLKISILWTIGIIVLLIGVVLPGLRPSMPLVSSAWGLRSSGVRP